ncbi:AfsR/SARP family transcriptional regulator [Kitasatospora herbaricolor]|uniref:Tetratricopeptide repeat protein n=1 Tax=Kitasatospora herbaricolor TaxID=68217 RepID=A0ABZ1WDT7_9ACTN|nr:BTAD domain-containing putative transcriptional regulator [Kitasatospora herbaricolor]
MRFGLLGPLTVHSDAGTGRPVGALKSRTLLTALLLRPGRQVPIDTLKEALWGEHPPATATASLHNHVARLRRALATDGDSRLRAVPQGFLLHVEPGELDTELFAARLAAARTAHQRQDWTGVERESAAALELWRGRPLADVPAFAEHPLVDRLTDQHLQVLEWRYDAALQLGQHEFLTAELGSLTREHPYREAFHRQLMLALHRTNRQADAIAAFHALRRALVDELGVEPGRAVREAYQEILTTQPGPAEQPAPAAARPRPAQLPVPPAHFVGRSEQIRAVHAALTGEDGQPAVAVVSGMAGVGKTGLALQVSRALREHFPDGQLFLNLHGATQGVAPLEPVQALGVLLRGLGVEPRLIPGDADTAAALLRSTLDATRTLIVLDDAASAAQVRPLLPAGPGCAVLVTSRPPLAALDGATHIPLAPLTADESTALITSASGREPADDCPAVRRLVELCGQLPLALRVVAARLAVRRALTAEALVELLTDEERRLDQLEYDDLSVRRSLAVAHDALLTSEREDDRDAAIALRRIGALDLAEYGAPLLARLMDDEEPRAAAALERLVDVALLEETDFGSYAPHDLVRDFARELAGRLDPLPAREAAVARALRWYAAAARESVLAILPAGGERDRRLPEPVGTAQPFADSAAAFAWCDRELTNMAALAVNFAGVPAHREVVLALARSLSPYLQRRGRVEALRVLSEIALTTARAAADPSAQGQAFSDLAAAHYMAGQFEAALALNDQAIEVWRALGDDDRVQPALGNRGLLLRDLGRAAEATVVLEECLLIARRRGVERDEAIVLSTLGNLREKDDPRLAIHFHRLSLESGERIGDSIIRQAARTNIGYAHLTLGEPDQALPHFETCMRLLTGNDDWHHESQARLGLVRSLHGLRRDEEADRECQALLGQAAERGDTYAQGLAQHVRGLILDARGRRAEAVAHWQEALRALAGTDSPLVAELEELLAPAVLAAPAPAPLLVTVPSPRSGGSGAAARR